MGNGGLSGDEGMRRRRRINLYKRIIIFTIILLILLPTSLCVILFFKVNNLKQEIKSIRTSMVNTESADDSNEVDNTTEPEESSDTSEETSDGQVAVVETTTAVEQPSDVISVQTSETEMVAEAVAAGRKVVYLTFDDGPCANTSELLDVLDSFNVKATFFVVGNQTGYEDVLVRIVKEGHTLGMHSYTHDYSKLYVDVDSFANELKVESDYLYQTTGVIPDLFRFPGGSSNSQTKTTISTFVDYLNSQNITYFDWNVSSGDSGGKLTSQDIYNNVINGIAKNDVSVVLMHDSEAKKATFEAVPQIIEALQAMNALILPITDETVPVHHNIN